MKGWLWPSCARNVGVQWREPICPMPQRIDPPDCKRLAANLGLLAYAAVFCLTVAGDGLAFERRTAAAGRLAAARPFAPTFRRNAGPAAHRPFPGEAGFTGIPPRGETGAGGRCGGETSRPHRRQKYRFRSTELYLPPPVRYPHTAGPAAAAGEENPRLSACSIHHHRRGHVNEQRDRRFS